MRFLDSYHCNGQNNNFWGHFVQEKENDRVLIYQNDSRAILTAVHCSGVSIWILRLIGPEYLHRCDRLLRAGLRGQGGEWNTRALCSVSDQ